VWQHPLMQLAAADLEDYAQGCAVLGSGGGGDVDVAVLHARAALEAHGPVEVLPLDALDGDALIMPVAGWGAPTVGIEKLGSGREGRTLADAVQRWFGRPVAAVMSGEIGGSNGVMPVALAAELGVPLVDADGMGRAFPEGPQVAMHVAGRRPEPVFLTDEHGNLVTLEPADGAWYERLARTIAVAFGGTTLGADFVMTASDARGAVVPGTVTLARRLGEALRTGGADAVVEASGGIAVFEGTVVDLERRTTGGFARGTVTVDGTGGHEGTRSIVRVQNENLLIERAGRPLAIVPDLIVLLDDATGRAVATERVRFGQRLRIVGIPCAPVWRTAGGLAVAGPKAFGYPHAYVPVEELARA
jgi:DUF917 family protein